MPSRPERVLITGARAPVALHMARLLAGAGCYVVIADSLRHCIGYASSACQTHEILPPFDSRVHVLCDAVQAIIHRHEITHILPTCEEVLYLARAVEMGDCDAQFIAPCLRLLQAAHNKASFIELAQEVGLTVPETRLLTSSNDVAALDLPSDHYVFKPVWSRFGTQVLIKPDDFRISPTKEQPWIAQNYLSGPLNCAYAVADRGRVTALAIYEPRYPAGRGGGTAFLPVIDDSITDQVTRFIAQTNWTGQISFDFIKTEDGPRPIECNPRATSGLHLFEDGPDFAGALFDGQVIKPKAQGLHGVRSAMAFFGGWRALRSGGWGWFIRDLRSVTDVIADPGDPAPARQQWRALFEFAWLASRRRISLQAASTYDIAWNGPDSTAPYVSE